MPSLSTQMAISAYTRKIAIALAFAGALPTPLPLVWLHKFYLGQYLWGIVYLVLAPTLLPQVACCLEGIWYLSQSDDSFVEKFPPSQNARSAVAFDPTRAHASVGKSMAVSLDSQAVSGETIKVDSHAIATSSHPASQVANTLRELDQLRQEGLITEYEFEQKRRKLLDQV